MENGKIIQGIISKLKNFNNLSQEERITLLKTIDELPDFLKNQLIDSFSNLTAKVLEKDEKSTNRFFDIIENAQKDISKDFDREDITAEERNNLHEKHMEYVKMASSKDTENKEYGKDVLRIAGTFFLYIGLGVGASAGAALLLKNGRFIGSAKNILKAIPKI